MLHYFNNKIFFILFALIFGIDSYGQAFNRKQKQLMFKGDKKFDLGDYPRALKIYSELLLIDSANYELNYKIGVCYFEDKKTRIDSKKYFYKALQPIK